jgi:hypothetical protein
MKRYEAFISGRLAGHGMPLELLAVPLAEAGYRNLPQGGQSTPRRRAVDVRCAYGTALWSEGGFAAR